MWFENGMVSIKEFIISLKLKMIIQNDNLLSMLNLDIIKLLLCEKAYIIKRIKYIGNNFWKNVLKSWLYFSDKIS